MNTKSIDAISAIIGSKLAIDGQEVRRMAITGTLANTTKAFYSAKKREQSPHEVANQVK